ncbi:MAG: glycosyltransferase [Alphaproteobacteria bacterium]
MTRRPRVGLAVAEDLHDYGLSRHLSENYAAAFRRLGWEAAAETLRPDDPRPLRRLLAPGTDLLFTHGGRLMAPGGPLGDGIGAALRAADKPVLMLLADPPFSPWLPPILDRLPPRTAAFAIDPGFLPGLPAALAAPYLPCAHLLDGHGPAATQDKDIPLLFVGALGDPDAVWRQVPQADKPAFRALTEAASAQPDRPLAELAATVLPACGHAAEAGAAAIRDLLHRADLFLRSRRRLAFARRVLRHPAVLVANIDAGLPDMHPEARILPAQPFPAMLALLRRARTAAICQPNYPGALNERIVFAMQARCVAIATANPRTRQLFAEGREILFAGPEGEDLDEAVAAAQDAEGIRDAAATRVAADFTPDGNLRAMLAAMASARLLDPGLAVAGGPRMTVPPLF